MQCKEVIIIFIDEGVQHQSQKSRNSWLGQVNNYCSLRKKTENIQFFFILNKLYSFKITEVYY